jgi:hypothetical protein
MTLPDGVYVNRYSGERYLVRNGDLYGMADDPYPYWIGHTDSLPYVAKSLWPVIDQPLHVRNCPACGKELDYRGEFDGRSSSTGVTGGHEGFGATWMCDAGHWWAQIQGALIHPDRILTVIDC